MKSALIIHTSNVANCDDPSLFRTFTTSRSINVRDHLYLFHASAVTISYISCESSSLAQLSIDPSAILRLTYPCFTISSQVRARHHYFYIVQASDLFKQIQRYVECHPVQGPQSARKSAFQYQRPNRRLEPERSPAPTPMLLRPHLRQNLSLRSQPSLTARFW